MTTFTTITGGTATGPSPQHIWATQPSVRKVVSFIARNIASVPWHAFERVDDTDRKRLARGPIEQALTAPSPGVTGYALMRDLVIDLMLYDSAALWLLDGELQRIPPSLLRGKVTAAGRLVDVQVALVDGPEPIDQAPHIILTGWDSVGGFGTSPLQTLKGLLDEGERAVSWRKDLWDRAAKFGGILMNPKGWRKAESRARFSALWEEFTHARAGSTPILEDGMTYETVTPAVKPVDAQDLEGRQLTDAEVAAAFHVPPELVGARQGTYSNVSAYRAMLFGPVLGPLLTEIEQALNAGIVPALADGAKVYVEADREAALAGSLSEQSDHLSTAVGGPWLTRAEARARLNLPRLEDTDLLITPLNVTEGGLASPRSTAAPSTTRAPRASEN